MYRVHCIGLDSDSLHIGLGVPHAAWSLFIWLCPCRPPHPYQQTFPFLIFLTCTAGVCIITSLTSRKRHRRERRRCQTKAEIAPEMYPHIKVREQEDVAVKGEEENSSVLRVIEILAIDVQPPLKSPAAKCGTKSENDPPLWHEKNHKSPVRSSRTSSLSTSRGKNAKIANDDKRTTKRASSVPRPRAVLSSPDNDDLIGKQNRMSKRPASPKIQSLAQSTKENNDDLIGKQNRMSKRPASPKIQSLSSLSQKNGGVGTPLRKEVSKEYEGKKDCSRDSCA